MPRLVPAVRCACNQQPPPPISKYGYDLKAWRRNVPATQSAGYITTLQQLSKTASTGTRLMPPRCYRCLSSRACVCSRGHSPHTSCSRKERSWQLGLTYCGSY